MDSRKLNLQLTDLKVIHILMKEYEIVPVNDKETNPVVKQLLLDTRRQDIQKNRLFMRQRKCICNTYAENWKMYEQNSAKESQFLD